MDLRICGGEGEICQRVKKLLMAEVHLLQLLESGVCRPLFLGHHHQFYFYRFSWLPPPIVNIVKETHKRIRLYSYHENRHRRKIQMARESPLQLMKHIYQRCHYEGIWYVVCGLPQGDHCVKRRPLHGRGTVSNVSEQKALLQPASGG